MANRFDSLEAMRAHLKSIAEEFSNERISGFPTIKDFHIRRLQIFCELLYADLAVRTQAELEDAVRLQEQEAIGKAQPPYTPPPDAPRTYNQKNTPPRDFVGELQAKAARF